MMFFVYKKYWVLVSVSVSDFKGLGLGKDGLSLEWSGLGLEWSGHGLGLE